MFLDPRISPFDESADRGRRGIENIDAVFFDDAPEAIVLGKIRGPLVHHHRRAGRERTVHSVAVPGDPADVSGAPVDVLLLEIEHPLHRHQRVHQVAAGRVHDTLGLAGGAGGVERVKRMLGVELGRRAYGALLRDQLVPPDVAPLAHLHLGAGAPEHHAMHDRGASLERLVDVGLERYLLSAAPSAVGRDAHLGLGIIDTVDQRLGRKAAEDHRMDRADTSARQHRDHRLGHQRHVDRDAIALLHAEALERVGRARDLARQHLVGQHAGVARLALPDERRLVAPRGGQMAVDAVVRRVELAVKEPLGERELPLQDLVEGFEPA